MKSQKKAWNKIAPEWSQFRSEPQKEVIKFLKNQKGKILDLGCGSGRNFIDVKEEIYGVDFSKKMLKFAKEKAIKLKIKLVRARAENLPFKNNFFDSAIFISSLHCIKTKKRREKALSELYRVLKEGAQARISVWNKNSKRFQNSPKEKFVNWRDKAQRYYYLYEPEEIYKEFEKVGFKILKKFIPAENIEFIVEK